MGNLLSVAFEAHSPERNHHRFYEVSIGRDLFQNWTVAIRFGSIGSGSQERRYASPEPEQMDSVIRDRLRRRLTARRGSGALTDSPPSAPPRGPTPRAGYPTMTWCNSLRPVHLLMLRLGDEPHRTHPPLTWFSPRNGALKPWREADAREAGGEASGEPVQPICSLEFFSLFSFQTFRNLITLGKVSICKQEPCRIDNNKEGLSMVHDAHMGLTTLGGCRSEASGKARPLQRKTHQISSSVAALGRSSIRWCRGRS
jgi:predicted DNA-binding WGR domain protein